MVLEEKGLSFGALQKTARGRVGSHETVKSWSRRVSFRAFTLALKLLRISRSRGRAQGQSNKEARKGTREQRTMEIQYEDITSDEAVGFCLPDPRKAREDTLSLLQVCKNTTTNPLLYDVWDGMHRAPRVQRCRDKYHPRMCNSSWCNLLAWARGLSFRLRWVHSHLGLLDSPLASGAG